MKEKDKGDLAKDKFESKVSLYERKLLNQKDI